MRTPPPNLLQRGNQNKLLEEAAPSIDELSQKAKTLYGEIDEMQAVVPPKMVAGLAEDIIKTLEKAGMDQDLSPKAYAAAQRILKDSNSPMTLGTLETLRRVAGGAATDLNKHESMLGGIIRAKIDDFVMQ